MNKWLYFLLSICIIGCQTSTTQIENIDLVKWKNDRFACNEYRFKSITALQKVKSDLLKMSEVEIMAMFGKPEKAELIEKSQKIYYYNLTRNINCSNYNDSDSIGKVLQIKFNSTGYANSVLFINNLIME